MWQALQSRSTTADSKSEKQLTTLLSIPLDTYNVVTVLSLKNYPNVMNLLATSVRKVRSRFYIILDHQDDIKIKIKRHL